MRGNDFVDALKRKLQRDGGKPVTDASTAGFLGITPPALVNWRKRNSITSRQMAGLLFKIREAGSREAEREAIRPIVEFFPLSLPNSRGGGKKEIFSVRAGDGQEHTYLRGLREQLERFHGIYVFHDSRGRALYAGKARKLRLWNEIKNAYNRKRDVQRIRRVRHPESKKTIRTSSEQRRQIRLTSVPLAGLAAYLSAYRVSDPPNPGIRIVSYSGICQRSTQRQDGELQSREPSQPRPPKEDSAQAQEDLTGALPSFRRGY